jgi:hypothetical protein
LNFKLKEKIADIAKYKVQSDIDYHTLSLLVIVRRFTMRSKYNYIILYYIILYQFINNNIIIYSTKRAYIYDVIYDQNITQALFIKFSQKKY